MWSHTIQSSKSNKAPAPNGRPAKVNSLTTKGSSGGTRQDEDMTQESEADGLSKTSRVRAAKKISPVSKAPTLSRTMSTKGEEPATPTDTPRIPVGKRAPKLAPTPAPKGVTPGRASRMGTPTQPPSIVAKANVPALSSRTKTLAQVSGTGTARAGSPAHGRPVVRSPKATEITKGRANTVKRSSKAYESPPLAGQAQEEGLSDNEPNTTATEGEDVAGADHNVDETPVNPKREDAEGVGRFSNPEVDHNDSNRQPEEQVNRKDREAHDELYREITLRNDTIKSLRKELQCLRSTQEHKGEGSDWEASAQIKPLRSELDTVRSALVDLEDMHRSTLEKHDSLLRSRDKIIQNLSSEAQELREKLEANNEASDQSSPDSLKKSQTVDQGQRPLQYDTVVQSKDEEIHSLSEIVQDLRKQLEAADTARAKEIYDELLKSKDEKIESVSGVVSNLRGELKAAEPARKLKRENQLLRSKDDEIRSLSETVQGLRNKLETTDQVKEQAVSHSVTSLRDEFQDLQNLHKRKIEDIEAMALKRAEALQLEYDDLLRSRDQEIKDITGMVHDLRKEFETTREGQRRELDDTITKYEGQLQEIRAQHDKELSAVHDEHAHELEAVRASHQDKDSGYQSNLQELIKTHKSELESVSAERQVAEMSHQQELRETRRKHEEALEAVKVEAQDEVRNEMTQLKSETKDASTRHQQEIENMQGTFRKEIGENAEIHDRALRDAALRHETELKDAGVGHSREVEAAIRNADITIEEESQRHKSELEEANTKYQHELADVERLRGQGSDDASQEHENQLRMIAEKYQQELSEAATSLADQASRYEHELQEVNPSLDEVKIRAVNYHRELEGSRNTYELLENENRIQGQRLQEWATKHEKEMETVSTKYQETMIQANTKMDQLVEEIASCKQKHQDRIIQMEREIMQVRHDFVGAAAEATSLKVVIEEMKLSRSVADDNMDHVHQQQLTEAATKHEQELDQLHREVEAAVTEVASYKVALNESDTLRREAIGSTTRNHEQSMRDATSKHEEDVSRLRQEYDNLTEETASLKHKLRDSEHRGGEAFREIASLRDTLKDKDLAQEEAKVEIALLKDNLELSDREIIQHKDINNELRRDIDGLEAQCAHSAEDRDRERKEAAVEAALLNNTKELADRKNCENANVIISLQKDIERIQARLADTEDDLNRERNEANVEVALLKDKLELADLQKQSASEDTSLSRNESNVEIALLKDKLELADLQSQQDKKAIAALREELQAHTTKLPDTAPYVHYQLREELAMLARHHATNVADVAALKASVLAEREVREEEWRNRAESRERIAKEMHGIGAELRGIVGAH